MAVLIVYATETGSAESLAYSTYQELYFREVNVHVKNASVVRLETFDIYTCVIFIVSTAAYGEFPHSMHKLVEELRHFQLEIKWSYTVFGLGDSRYPLFNHAARKLVAILDSIGVTAFYRVAYGDEQHPLGYLGEFITWIDGLRKQWNLVEYLHSRDLRFCLSMETLGTPIRGEEPNISCETGKIVSNDIVTSSDHFRVVRNVLIDCKDMKYDPGDICCIYPTGDPKFVAETLRKIGFNPDEIVLIRHKDGQMLEFNHDLAKFSMLNDHQDTNEKRLKLPYEDHPIAIKTLYSQFLSLHNLCTQWQMYIMARFTDFEMHREKLLEMATFTIEGCAEYNRYCKDERRALFEVLCDFDSVKLPLEVLINISTPYYPRMYSIASTPTIVGLGRPGAGFFDGNSETVTYTQFKKFLQETRKRAGVMELCVAQVIHSTPYNRKIEGQASDFFTRALPNQCVRYSIIKSPVARAVLDVSIPVLFICTGTGIAAVKPLLEGRMEKFIHMWNNHFRKPKVKDLAFFGFRRKRQDHLYLGDTRLLRMLCDVEFVYSRESGKKVYVQDVMNKFATRVVEILMNGLVVISGKSHPMPKQVITCLRDMLVEHSGFGIKAADKFMESALMGRKIILDTWG